MENTAKTSMELAISEKKTPKPGGCVGIFVQLFEWKRRLAENKLFPKKILPPGRAKQCYKKFKAIAKMPSSKLHLIADENSGSFVNRKDSSRVIVNSVKEHEMRAPTLVARLMGLDSMPLVNRDKPKKASVSESFQKGSEREDRDFEKGSVKIDTRPQKLRKTDSSEKHMVTRFGQEALPFKSVLSQSRKNHRQVKLPLPINSPRFSSGRNVKRTSQLIDAASRILEPGLLATNRAKCAIAYSHSRAHASSGGLLNTERIKVLPLDERNAVKSSVGTTTREISDSSSGVGRVKRNTDENLFAYCSLDSSSDDLLSSETATTKTMPSRDFIFENNGHSCIDVTFVNEPAVGKLHLDRQYRCPSSSSHPRKLRKHSSSSFPLKYGNQRQNQPSPGRGKFSARSEINNLHSERVSLSANVRGGAKDSDALNHGISSHSRARVQTELENSKFQLEKTTMNAREEPRPQLRTSVRKRRMIGAGGFVDSQTVVDLNKSRQSNFDYDKLIDKRSGLDPCSTNHSCVKIILNGQGQAKGVHGQNRDIISFAFRSPLITEGEVMDNGRRVSFQKEYSLREDAIGALLEQKLNELSSREDDDTRMGALAERSELIAASTDDFTRSHDFSFAESNVDFNVDVETEISTRMSKDGNHFSPGSVLEASFSSSSMDHGSGTNTRSRLPADIMDYTSDRLHPPEADLFDSATYKIGSRRLSEIIENVSLIIKTVGLSGVRLTGSKLSHANEVLLCAELMFGNAARRFVDETIADLLGSPLFIDGNETMAGVQRGFLFDCLIEFMDSKYRRFYNSGFKGWTGLVSRLHGRTMIEDFGGAVREWISFLEMCLDEMIELEMSRSTGKWMDFGFEGFETGADIEQHILLHLVEEILVDMRLHPPSGPSRNLINIYKS